MLRIFTTQLFGYFKDIQTDNEFSFEDASRLLAQTIIGDGDIYIKGFEEMEAIEIEATKGPETLPKVKAWKDNDTDHLTSVDRVIMITRTSNDQAAMTFAKQLKNQGVFTVGISAIEKDSANSLNDYVDLHIDSKLRQAIVPAEDGSKMGYPSILTALYCYFGLYLTTKEILLEHEEEMGD